MASVRKRKWTYNGQDKEAWVVAYTDQGGKRRIKTFDKKKDADRYRTQVETELEQRIHVPERESMTFREATLEYEADCQRKRRQGAYAGSSIKAMMYYLDIANGYFGATKLPQLTTATVQAMAEKEMDRLAVGTVRHITSAVNQVLKLAVRRKWLRRNILRDEPLVLPAAETPKAKVPSLSNIQKLLEVTGARLQKESAHSFTLRRLLVCLGVFAGFRIGEMCGLHWSEVDLDRGILRVRHSMSEQDGLKPPKTRAGVRDVPITQPVKDALLEVLRYWQIRRRVEAEHDPARTVGALKQKIQSAWADRSIAVDLDAPREGLVFLNRDGGPSIPPHVQRGVWRIMADKAGLYGSVTVHGLRHAAASLYISEGLPAFHLKNVMGHAKVAMTYDVYGHLFPEDDVTSRTANAIAARFDATRERQERVVH